MDKLDRANLRWKQRNKKINVKLIKQTHIKPVYHITYPTAVEKRRLFRNNRNGVFCTEVDSNFILTDKNSKDLIWRFFGTIENEKLIKSKPNNEIPLYIFEEDLYLDYEMCCWKESNFFKQYDTPYKIKNFTNEKKNYTKENKRKKNLEEKKKKWIHLCKLPFII